MGMYDTIVFNCPNCGTQIEAQSKSGECVLGVFDYINVPTTVAKDANRHAPFECEKCHQSWYFEKNVPDCPSIVHLSVKLYTGEDYNKESNIK